MQVLVGVFVQRSVHLRPHQALPCISHKICSIHIDCIVHDSFFTENNTTASCDHWFAHCDHQRLRTYSHNLHVIFGSRYVAFGLSGTSELAEAVSQGIGQPIDLFVVVVGFYWTLT